jgi:hypothetical protein
MSPSLARKTPSTLRLNFTNRAQKSPQLGSTRSRQTHLYARVKLLNVAISNAITGAKR